MLKRIAAESGMDIITLRPPLALVNNRRNLICVSNLENATVCCMYAPAGAVKRI